MSIEGTVTTEENVVKGKLIAIPEIDKTLTKDGYSADAKVVGERLDTLAEAVGQTTTPKAENIPYGDTTVKEALDNTFSKSGGMVDGTVMMRNADNGYGSVMKNNSATADYGTQLADISASGNTAKVTVNATSNLLTFTDANGDINDVFHDGNKAFSSYTGDGNESTREINTKGIGKLLMVYSTTSLCYVTPKGASVITLETGEQSWIDSAKVFYVDGKLTLNTTNEAFNTNGETYYYQVI